MYRKFFLFSLAVTVAALAWPLPLRHSPEHGKSTRIIRPPSFLFAIWESPRFAAHLPK